MCVKTKTKFGCGHSFKSLAPCRAAPSSSSPCSEIDRYFYIGEGDCNRCRAGGEGVTRGREGQGLYAQEIEKRQRHQQQQQQQQRGPLSEVSGNQQQSRHRPVDSEPGPKPIVTPDPWAPITRREKEWQSPHRRSADEAWLREHESIQREMELLSNSHARSSIKSSSTSSSPSSKPRHSRNVAAVGAAAAAAAANDYDHRYELDDEQHNNSNHRHRGRDSTSSRLQSEIRRIDTAREKARARGAGVRSGSYESIESTSPTSAVSSQWGRRGRSGYAGTTTTTTMTTMTSTTPGFTQAVEVVGGNIIETRSPTRLGRSGRPSPRSYDYASEYNNAVPRMPAGYTTRRRS